MDLHYEFRRGAAFLQTKLSPACSLAAVVFYAKRAGFKKDDLVTAVALANAATGFRTHYRKVTKDDDDYRGIFGLNVYANWPLPSNLNDLYDPMDNAKYAYRHFHAGGFARWKTYEAQGHIDFVPEAYDAVLDAGYDVGIPLEFGYGA